MLEREAPGVNWNGAAAVQAAVVFGRGSEALAGAVAECGNAFSARPGAENWETSIKWGDRKELLSGSLRRSSPRKCESAGIEGAIPTSEEPRVVPHAAGCGGGGARNWQ